MILTRALRVAAILMGETTVFLLALLAVARPLGDSLSWWVIVAMVGAAYLVIGAVPVPRGRRPLLVGLSAFVAPLVILGWTGWRVELLRLFEHLQVWEGLPRVLLAPANVATAVFLSSCALLGCGLARRRHRGGSFGADVPRGHGQGVAARAADTSEQER